MFLFSQGDKKQQLFNKHKIPWWLVLILVGVGQNN